MKPSEVLEILANLLGEMPPGETITAGSLKRLVDEAAKSARESEYYDAMGQDM